MHVSRIPDLPGIATIVIVWHTFLNYYSCIVFPADGSRVISYEDGSTAATCSLHCTAVELANSIDKIPVTIRVADYDSKELIDAETAVWVMGGSKKGVMTASYDDMYKDTKMIRENRKMRRHKH